MKYIFVVFCLFISSTLQAEAASNGPMVLYTFNQVGGSVVHDVSGTGTPMDLEIRDTGSTRWLFGGGLAVDKPTLITTTGPASKITDAVKASNALTIEAWIQPASTMQSGPARIMTLSADPYTRNFTLAQKPTAYVVRLRTTETGKNGMRPSLPSPDGTLGINLTHVVYTLGNDGIAQLYINGTQRSEKIVGSDLSSWDDSYEFALANELSGDRPWIGSFYQVAIYDRVLSVSEIDMNFAAGVGGANNSSTDQSSYKPADNTSSDNTTIASTDSSNTVSLSSFSIPVSSATPITTGSVFLEWEYPVTRSDGSALAMSEIAGYTIHFLSSVVGNLNSIAINDAHTTSITFTDMPEGTYYFVITARDTYGRESEYSNMVTKLVQ